ncbi:PREDICTED: nucleolin-like isoform X1 [Prunus mume]|uniref:Nucleolin-like isoform X1 n=2 Tax=Prunus mume TaxID=102107 RepID=A0ABM0PQV5_PRUMU|nr:PREDICTED: nucleolin-like isoform X1 [Prunus mume]
MSAVFFYTARWCRTTYQWITPIFDELREQFPHITMFKVYTDQNISGSMLDKLGIQDTPTFHCYLKGERVDEIAGYSVRHLKKRLENVYNPSGMKKRRRQGKEDDKDGGIVEVLPSRLPETSIQKVILELKQLIFDEDDQEDDQEYDLKDDQEDDLKDDQRHDQDKMWWFAKGLVSCEKKMKIFCKLKDPEAKLKWIKREMAKVPRRLPETSILKVFLELKQLIFDEDDQRHDQDKMWWFVRGLVSCEKKMKIFCKLKDPKARLKWIKREMAKE